MLRNSALAKVALLVLITIVLCIPLAQIRGLIDERGGSQLQAAHELAASHAGPQVVVGPLLVMPYVERWTEVELNDKGQVKARIARSKPMTHLVFPEKVDLKGRMAPQERYRGIFKVLFYDLDGAWKGSFPAFDPAALAHTEKDSTFELQPPVFAFGLQDVRGIQGAPALRLAGETAKFLPRIPGAADGSWLARGIHAPVAGAALQAWERREPVAFDMKMVIIGQERLSIAPLADETTTHLTSTWPHPSFGGQFLAVQRTVTDSGFEASWAVSSLVSSARKQILASQGGRDPRAAGAGQADALDSFDVTLAQPLNVYSQSTRAVKYGALFVALVLMAAFMFELFKKLRLHPVQYALVGLAIALFFLLLLALSEKVEFWLAYTAAAGASVLLLMVYFSAVLKGWKRGVSLAGYVALLYGTLYGLLASENNALLLGALLLFGMLALLMIATRRVDWYALSGRDSPAPMSGSMSTAVPASA
ncbi:cell envelope integrity protein CreD [Ramlibacter sp. WS9]|uniref:cell envelope integrity protein CreD n=1 Tax=Ramlibacter sp. WS9 TaxID=1882741 RepID=UPI001E33144A|nr:cell envelope integrity protein CreD [Ramlibacter sp. WS9]